MSNESSEYSYMGFGDFYVRKKSLNLFTFSFDFFAAFFDFLQLNLALIYLPLTTERLYPYH